MSRPYAIETIIIYYHHHDCSMDAAMCRAAVYVSITSYLHIHKQTYSLLYAALFRIAVMLNLNSKFKGENYIYERFGLAIACTLSLG